jgi:acyl-CoA thioesterase FadM
MQLSYRGLKDGVEHLTITQTVCFLDLDSGRSIPIPDDMRGAIEGYLVA